MACTSSLSLWDMRNNFWNYLEEAGVVAGVFKSGLGIIDFTIDDTGEIQI